MEAKRVSGGRRGVKKEITNNASKITAKKKGKGAEDVNVLRTRSGRTRAAATLDKSSNTRKKACLAKASLKEDLSDNTEELDDESNCSALTNKVLHRF